MQKRESKKKRKKREKKISKRCSWQQKQTYQKKDEIQRFREDLEEICENVCTCEKKEEKQTKIKEKKEKEGEIIKMKN